MVITIENFTELPIEGSKLSLPKLIVWKLSVYGEIEHINKMSLHWTVEQNNLISTRSLIINSIKCKFWIKSNLSVA